MKHPLLLFSALIISIAAIGQSTWTQRLNYADRSPYSNGDSVTGIIDIEVGADNDLYILASVDQDALEYIFKISPDDSAIKWSVEVGLLSATELEGFYTNNVYPTADSGCVISCNEWFAVENYNIVATFQKYSKDGTLQWSQQSTSSNYDMSVKYILQDGAYGTYYAFVGDSVFELNTSGNIVTKFDTVSNIYSKPNGDLILQTVNGVYCTDTAGNINWSLPGYNVLASFSSYIFVTTDSNYQKINTSNGSVVWSLPSWSIPSLNVSSIDYTPDGGVIASCGLRPEIGFPGFGGGGGDTLGTLFKIDSSGTVLWSKSYNFPEFGLSCVKQLPSGNIITGGTFIFTNSDHEEFATDYSAFIASLDSAGNGQLQTTTYMWPGDANNNQYLSFVDDALYVMVADGDTGPKRDILIGQDECCGLWSDYASDWPNSFCTGVNVKYADFNGDGVIDTNDIAIYPDVLFSDMSVAPWRKSDSFDRVASNPDFKLVPEYDTIPAGDSITFYIIAGNSSMPVDSIYGLAFSFYAYFPDFIFNCPDSVSVNFRNSSLGTLGTNLYTFNYRASIRVCLTYNQLISRIDHQNIYNLNDTLGYITIYTNSSQATDSLMLQILEFNAVTSCGSVVPFNVSGTSTVVVYNRVLSVNESNKEHLNIYPNPANHSLTINSTTVSNKKIEIYNSLGELVNEFESPDAMINIQTDKLINGVYRLLVTSEQWSKNAAFAVEH